MNTMGRYIKVYTREPETGCYPAGLAYSVHMAYSTDRETFRPLNKNYGILFAEAEIREDNTIFPKGVKDPGIVVLENDCYGIVATRINESGDLDENCNEKFLLWKTEDFIEFEYVGPVEKSRLVSRQISDRVELSREVFETAVQYWSPVFQTGAEVAEYVEAKSARELCDVKATVVYSDGSVSLKKIDWETENIDFQMPGVYEIKGKICSEKYPFPLTKGYGDPVLFRWEGKWYYIATNDNKNAIGLYVREADTVKDLFAEDTKEHIILAKDESRQLIQTFWAPEFHIIGGELYILFAVSGKAWGPQCHMMKLKKGGHITDPDSWESPIRVRRMDGTFLAEGAITLDMTYIKTVRASYVVWSYREHIGTPLDSGSMLFIATVEEREPWKLTSDPVLLTRPLLGWENVEGTINNEGPYAFIHDSKVYLSYSGGSADSYTYAVGLLTALEEDDLLDIDSWKKRSTPVLSFYSVEGEYGPGHNSFYVNENGDLMIAYHGETAIDLHLRCDGIRRVHFRKGGVPDFGMSAEEDFSEALREITTKLIIK